jgi:bacteriocin biosynthesis cyclodehydratase domain-containing protein
VQPDATACLACLEAEHRRANPLAGELERMRKADPRPAATLGPACGLIGSMIALDALQWLTGAARPATWNAVLTTDIRTLATERTEVARDPGCASCRTDS